MPTRRPARRSRGVPVAPGVALLLGLVTVAAVGFRSEASTGVPEAYADLFRAAARDYPAVSAAQLAAHAKVESGFRPRAESGRGAQGLMQFVPATWAAYGVDGNGDGRRDVFEPADAVPAAARYLTALERELRPLGGDTGRLAIAAYNAGPGAVRRYGGVPPYDETQDYVRDVLTWTERYEPLA